MDLRLLKPAARDEPQGKVSQAVENIFRIRQETKPERSAQLVFCDLSTPKDKGFSVVSGRKRETARSVYPPYQRSREKS